MNNQPVSFREAYELTKYIFTNSQRMNQYNWDDEKKSIKTKRRNMKKRKQKPKVKEVAKILTRLESVE